MIWKVLSFWRNSRKQFYHASNSIENVDFKVIWQEVWIWEKLNFSEHSSEKEGKTESMDWECTNRLDQGSWSFLPEGIVSASPSCSQLIIFLFALVCKIPHLSFYPVLEFCQQINLKQEKYEESESTQKKICSQIIATAGFLCFAELSHARLNYDRLEV